MRLWTLREEITQSFGLVGQVLRPSEYYSISAKTIEKLLDEIRAEVEPSRPDSLGSGSSSQFKIQFELRYHPKFGSYHNSVVMDRLFEELWPEVMRGSIDAFELYHRLRSLNLLTPEERAEALTDAMWTWQINPGTKQ